MTLFARYFHTLRHLRPVQIYGRLWFRLYRPRPDSRPAPPLRIVAGGSWVAPPAGEPRLLGPVTFRFLDETRTLADPGDWNRPDWDKLWLYNLHYFDDLNAEGAGVRREWQCALIARWIADNPPGHGNGWEPYPLSLRIVNWVQWLLAGHAPQPSWLDSLAMQARYLARRLEWHLLGNHLFANAKALVHVGLFFDGSEADSWLAAGLRVLDRQLPEQILPDGGHFELSPMYHAILLKDVLDLLNLAQVYPGRIGASQTAQWRDAASRMLDWLHAMTHPDGGLAFFNDAAFGIAPTLAELVDYARRLGMSAPAAALSEAGGSTVPSRFALLPDSGYARLQTGPAVLLADVGMIGPEYLPGHAHADTLSFELSLYGQRVVVNSGTSCYGTGPERQRQRGTAAHNTVVVNGQDSSEVWGGFRVARRARPLGLRWGEEGAEAWIECGHDGYRRLPGRPLHFRRWQIGVAGLSIHDRIGGGCRHAVARYHFHPTVRVELNPDRQGGTLQLLDGTALAFRLATGAARMATTTWHPRFGTSEPNVCLEIPFNGPEAYFSIRW